MTSETVQRPVLPSPREHRWPGLHQAPHSPARAAVARALLSRVVSMVDLQVVLPDGKIIGPPGDDRPVLRVVRDDFFHRLGVDGKIGFGEAYMVGDWVSDDLPAVLTVLAAKLTTLVPPWLQGLRRWYDPRHPEWDVNTRERSGDNTNRHYDLSNEMFELFLGETMLYSAGWYEDGDTLEAAQLRKVDGILDLARVGPDTHLLEIGTGWGTLALRAATERGARVTAITMSGEQKAYAEARFSAAGVADRIEVQIRDYRDIEGRYDAIASVEMIEAVGDRYWPDYFRVLDRLLKPGGHVGLQVITMPHERMLATRNSFTWIQKYIFAGGLLPSVRAVEDTLAEHTTLRIFESRDLGLDYVPTLREWRRRFLDRVDEVQALGFDDTFVRMWDFYLAYCEAGFAVRYIGDSQLGLARNH